MYLIKIIVFAFEKIYTDKTIDDLGQNLIIITVSSSIASASWLPGVSSQSLQLYI